MSFLPSKGCVVKLFFRSPNFQSVEGIVEEWSDDECVLLSLDKSALLIIKHLEKEMLAVKIALEVSEPATQSPAQSSKSEFVQMLEQQEDSTKYDYPGFFTKQDS